jgi:hypothetical protein
MSVSGTPQFILLCFDLWTIIASILDSQRNFGFPFIRDSIVAGAACFLRGAANLSHILFEFKAFAIAEVPNVPKISFHIFVCMPKDCLYGTRPKL